MAAVVLSEGGILLHVGPHKTGTTAIQGALAMARKDLARAGILYPGSRQEHSLEAQSAIQRRLGWDRVSIAPERWGSFAKKLRRAHGRVVISSEVFCEAKGDAVARVVGDLEPKPVQVVVTLRPLEQLLPSSWQQYIKSGYRVRYDRWLDSVLASREARTVTPSFWVRQHHPRLIRRWADVVGPQNVIVVVVAADQPRGLFAAFESLLRLPPGMLNHREGPTNRSLSAPEAELLRQLNRRARRRVDHADYHRFVKRRAVRSLVEHRVPRPDEPRLVTPARAIQRAREFSRADVAEIASMGVVVIGDLDRLAPTTPVPDEPFVQPATVSTRLAAAFMFSLLEAGIDIAALERAGIRNEEPSLVAAARYRLARLRKRV